MSTFKERLAKLSPEKQKLLLSQLQKQKKKELSEERILPRKREKGANSFALSYPQQRMFTIAQLMPGDTSYSVPLHFRLQGKLNTTALKNSFKQIAQKHEILRTTFHLETGESRQVIFPELTVDVPVIDLQDLSPEKQEAEVQRLLQEDTQSPFDLAKLPLWRVKLLKLAEQNHILLFNIHHIIFDGWSVGVFIRELKNFYEAYLDEKKPNQEKLPIQYVDYALWQKEQLQGEFLTSKLEYWQQQLQGISPLQLPTRISSLATEETGGAMVKLELSEALSNGVKALNLQEGTTLNTILLAAFFILLGRYSNQEELAVGSAIANRNSQEVEPLIGFFVNTIVLRADTSDNPTFIDFLARVKNTVLEAYEHREMPFDLLVEKLNPQRNVLSNPLAQVGFAFQNAPNPGFQIGELSIESIDADRVLSNARFDLEIHLWEGKPKIAGALVYKQELFGRALIEGMVSHYERLLEAIIVNPLQQINHLPIITEIEQQKLLVEWNNTKKDYPTDKCIHQLFEEQVEKTPDAVAVVLGEQKITYFQLNRKANQLAHYLQKLGVVPETIVGICVERSVEMIVGLLAILKAGGAYVPLDPVYPQERLEYMFTDSQVSVLLTQEQLLAQLPQNQTKVVCLDRDWEKVAAESPEKVSSEVTPSNLAYVIYTSGSTGKPKGVLVEHKGLCNLVTVQIQAFQVNSNSRVVQFASLSFDASIWEIVMALGSGASLYLGSRDTLMPGASLSQWLRKKKITHITIPPSALAVMPKEELPDLKTIVVAGEACSPKLIPHWSKGRQFVNAYGPTESTVCATMAECSPEYSVPPIGRPIGNTQIYILDKNLQPVPIGVPGEIYIGGVGLARGYLNRDNLTNQRFISNPWENSKLYKTGDLGRYLADGNIEFLGRIDHQVKVRGYRIETGEIEATLTQHPHIKQTVVVAREDNSGERRIVAYIVPEIEASITSNPELLNTQINSWQQIPNQQLEEDNGNNPLSSQLGKQLMPQLRDYLKERLPEYMVPSGYVVLSQLPLTPNGKVDRKALPAPDFASNVSTEYVAPETETEKLLAEIWAEVLRLEKVGRHDNFFDIGGHSLLATQLISQIRQSFEQDVPLKTLFEFPTIAELEPALLKLKNSSEYESDIPLPTIIPAPEKRYQPFPLTEVQQAYWLGRNSAFELGNVATHGYMELDCENLNIEQLSQAWQRVIEHHDMLRVVVLADGQQQVLEQVPPYQIEVLDLREHSKPTVTSELETIRHQMSQEILPADQWPLFKIRATRLDEKLYRLHWSFDALIADARSTVIFWQQWLQLYQNPVTILPKVELSFRDYMMAELSLKKAPQYLRSQQYWLKRLDNLPPSPELPLVKPLSTLKQPKFRSDTAQLSKTDWQQLKQRAKQANLTPSGVLLAAFADFLTYWSKSPKFTINLTLFNRLPLHPQINEVVGDFTSLTLLEVNNSAIITFKERAQRIQAQLWEDLDHRYVGGVEVQRELRRYRGSYQPMGVVFTSTLGLDSMNEQLPSNQEEFPLSQLGELVYMVNKTPQVWLDHGVVEHEGALILIWNVVEELFPNGLLEEMFTSYHNWLQQLATSDEAWTETQLQLLPPTHHKQRVEVNKTTALISEDTLHGLFIKQVEQQGEAIAIITPECTLTYQQLYTQANKIGKKLQQLGATPNTLVAVLMTKGWEQVAAVLGILMSGAAYLPIDPALPQERQWHLLEQGEVKLVLTQANLAESLSLPEKIQCLSVDAEEWSAVEVSPFDLEPSTADLAYVIFTSGSTGTPKGVMIDHRGAVNTVLDINQRFDIQPNDRILAVSALNFDLSVYDIFGVLAAGATIVIPSSEVAKDPAHWVELMAKHQVTLWNTVPALMQMLVEYLFQHSDLSSFPLRLALLSGDWIPLNLPEQVKTFWSQAQVISLGGATEASIWSVYYPITTVEPEWKSIPYGKPLTNQSLHVLNERMEPCPNWVPGQLYIGGIGIAQGYWRNQEKTNASFIIYPHTGERLYKTGDLARYLSDGNTEFLGREDFQVKISGYRIELGEIEISLQKHTAVKETVVTAVGELQNKQLVAYVVLHSEATTTIDELRDHLQQYLPEYMVPPYYIFLEALPLTANGKIDRKRLPTPELKLAPTTKNYVPPRNSQELQLVKMWEDILGVKSVGVCSNFFELGGHSLLAVRLMNRIEQELGQSLPLSTLFQSSTVEQLAGILTKEQVVYNHSPLVPIQPKGSQLPIFCVHPAGGTVFCYLELAQLLGKEQPFYGLQCLGQVEGEEPLTSVEDMAAVYQKALREVQPKGPYILMGWSFGGMVALEIANNLLTEGEQVAFLGLIDTYTPSQLPDEEQLSENVEVVLELFGGNLSLPWEELRELSQEEQVTLIWQQARQANLVYPDFEATQLERLLHIMKLNHKAMRNYSLPTYPGVITLFRAEAGSVAVSQEVVGVDTTLGWKEVAIAGVEINTVPGYHEYMVHQPNVAILANQLQSCIEKSLSTYQQNCSQD